MEPSMEQVESLKPKAIVYNKLNKLIIAHRKEAKANFQKDCPYCGGENPQCKYFNLFMNETVASKSLAKAIVEVQIPLEEIRQALAGQVITVKAGLIEYDLDLGAKLSLAKRYLNLYAAYPELPFLRDIGNRLGFYPKSIDEATELNLQYLILFPSLLIWSDQLDFSELTDESRAEICNWFRAVLNDLDQSETERLYLGLELIPLHPATDPWGNIVSGNPRGKQHYFAEIVDLQLYLRLEKYIFQRLSDIEERILIELELRKPGEKEYSCSGLDEIHTKLRQEFTEIVETVWNRIAQWR